MLVYATEVFVSTVFLQTLDNEDY